MTTIIVMVPSKITWSIKQRPRNAKFCSNCLLLPSSALTISNFESCLFSFCCCLYSTELKYYIKADFPNQKSIVQFSLYWAVIWWSGLQWPAARLTGLQSVYSSQRGATQQPAAIELSKKFRESLLKIGDGPMLNRGVWCPFSIPSWVGAFFKYWENIHN